MDIGPCKITSLLLGFWLWHQQCDTQTVSTSTRRGLSSSSWASYQIRKIAGCACTWNAGNIFPPPQIRGPDMDHGTCVTHVPWCMPGSLTCVFLWSWWRGKRSRHSRCMPNPQFDVSGKRSMAVTFVSCGWCSASFKPTCTSSWWITTR